MRRMFAWKAVTARLAIGSAIILAGLNVASAQEGVALPAPVADVSPGTAATETAVFAGGCFWGVQGVFQHVSGVKNAVSGYAGGAKQTANYESVGSGKTGHAEAVKVTYDPKQVTYGHLLQIYFSVAHDPTELNRQGPDIGTQYRSAIFPENEDQGRVAKAYIAQLNKARLYDAAIVTTIEPGHAFYPAEAYHQDFLTNNLTYPYIVYNDLPKLENLRKLFAKDFREKPVLVAKNGI